MMPKTPHSSRGPSRTSMEASERRVPCERPGRVATARRRAARHTVARSALLRCAHGLAPSTRAQAERSPQEMTMAVNAPVQIDRQRIKELIEREEQALNERTRSSDRCTSARTRCSPAASPRPTSCATRGRSTSSAATARRSGTSTATRCTTSTTASARWSRATRTRRSARAIQRALRAGHALRRADRGRDRRRRGAPAPLGPAALALHELRLRVDDGRDPDRARATRAATP